MLYTDKRCIEHIDTDASGVVHFSRYAIFFETVFLNFIRQQSHQIIDENLIHSLRVTQLDMNFIAPAKFAEILQIDMFLIKIRQVTFELGFVLHAGNVELQRNKAKMTFCYVDKSNKPAPIPECILKILGEVDVCTA
jgi:YbgC/YbaW family acyl-CoA thioester hydrolase